MPKSSNPVTKRGGSSINLLLTVIVLVVAVGVIGGILYAKGGNKGQQASGDKPVPAETLNPPGANMLSKSPDGKVTLTEFLDFQCPSCQGMYQQLTKELEQKYQGRINYVARNYPLQMHPLAQEAAHTAEAAAAQGKYPEMYHALNDNWSQWAVDSPSAQEPSSNQQRAHQLFQGYAQQIGLDMNKFNQDVNSPAVDAKVKKDMADGDKAGVSGTPTFFLNGKQLQMQQGMTKDQLYKQIDGLLGK